MKKIKKILVKSLFLIAITATAIIISPNKASASACVPTVGMGTVNTGTFNAVNPGLNAVWVRIQSAYPTSINLNVETTPSGGASTCFQVKSPNPTSPTVWSWVKVGTFTATAANNNIKLYGVDPGVRVDRVIAFDASSSCVPSNVRVTTGTPSEPGDNCVPVSPTPTITDATAPVGPTILNATASSSSQVALTWPSATDNNGIKNYEIYRNNLLINTSTVTNYNDTGLTAATTYSYKVIAVDSSRNKSAGSNASVSTLAVDNVAPTTPTGLTSGIKLDAGKSAYYVDLKWNPSIDNVAVKDYVIKKNNVIIGSSNQTLYKDFSIKADTNYTYQVQARDSAGNLSPAASTVIVARCFLLVCWKG